MAMTLALVALVTLVSCAAKSLMHINELDLITVKIDIYRRDSYILLSHNWKKALLHWGIGKTTCL